MPYALHFQEPKNRRTGEKGSNPAIFVVVTPTSSSVMRIGRAPKIATW